MWVAILSKDKLRPSYSQQQHQGFEPTLGTYASGHSKSSCYKAAWCSRKQMPPGVQLSLPAESAWNHDKGYVNASNKGTEAVLSGEGRSGVVTQCCCSVCVDRKKFCSNPTDPLHKCSVSVHASMAPYPLGASSGGRTGKGEHAEIIWRWTSASRRSWPRSVCDIGCAEAWEWPGLLQHGGVLEDIRRDSALASHHHAPFQSHGSICTQQRPSESSVAAS